MIFRMREKGDAALAQSGVTTDPLLSASLPVALHFPVLTRKCRDTLMRWRSPRSHACPCLDLKAVIPLPTHHLAPHAAIRNSSR